MATKIELIREEQNDHGIIGKTLTRTYEVNGMFNTSGDPEVYRVRLNGQFNDGSVRFDVFVQRPNGSFANLNNNRHHQRCAAAFAALRPILAEYKAANQAVRNS